MGDLFHENVADDLIAWVTAVMAFANWHKFLVLTKRPERARALLTSNEFADLVEASVSMVLEDEDSPIGPGRGWNGLARRRDDAMATAPIFDAAPVLLPNLWLGVTVESPGEYWRVGELMKIPAAVRFVSYEPALGYVDWAPYLGRDGKVPGIDWLIVGAETGPGKRLMRLSWAREARDRCKDARVPFFFKKDSTGAIPSDLAIHEFPA